MKKFILSISIIFFLLGASECTSDNNHFKSKQIKSNKDNESTDGPNCIVPISEPPRFESGIHRVAQDGNLKKLKETVMGQPDLVNLKAADKCYRYSPLHAAIQSESANLSVVNFLISRGADVNAKTKEAYTPLHFVANYGCWYTHHGTCHPDRIAKLPGAEIAESLIQAGSDVNARDNRGDTPLHTAAYCANFPVVKLLIKAGADVNAVNKSGESVLGLAKQPDPCWTDQVDEIVALLKKSGAR